MFEVKVNRLRVCLQVVLDNGNLYGFDTVETRFLQLEVREAVTDKGAISFTPTPFGSKLRSVAKIGAPPIPESPVRRKDEIATLTGQYQLNACVFQYRHVR